MIFWYSFRSKHSDKMVMQEQVDNAAQQLAASLFALDPKQIKVFLDAGVQPYALSLPVDGRDRIPVGQELSPYGIILEGYLHRVYGQDKLETILTALSAAENSIELLIHENIATDRDITLLEGNPTMRKFVADSIQRLRNEQQSVEGLDEEGEHALAALQRIDELIKAQQLS